MPNDTTISLMKTLSVCQKMRYIDCRAQANESNIMHVLNICIYIDRKAFHFKRHNNWHQLNKEIKQIESKNTFKQTLIKELSRDITHLW